MPREGYVKLFRKMTEWEWYMDVNTKVVFLHLLLTANWEASRFLGVEVPKGSVVTSYAKLSAETGLSVKTVRVALDHLKGSGEVASKNCSRFTVLTLNNYDFYQSEGQAKGQAEGKQGASRGQAKGNIKEEKEYKKNKKNNYSYGNCRVDGNAGASYSLEQAVEEAETGDLVVRKNKRGKGGDAG